MHADPERGTLPFAPCIDVRYPALAAKHARRGVDPSAYVTTFDRLERPLDTDANTELHAALVRTLRNREPDFFESIERHPSNGWPGKTGCLVFGLSHGVATTVGGELRQNAFVWSGPNAVPRPLPSS